VAIGPPGPADLLVSGEAARQAHVPLPVAEGPAEVEPPGDPVPGVLGGGDVAESGEVAPIELRLGLGEPFGALAHAPQVEPEVLPGDRGRPDRSLTHPDRGHGTPYGRGGPALLPQPIRGRVPERPLAKGEVVHGLPENDPACSHSPAQDADPVVGGHVHVVPPGEEVVDRPRGLGDVGPDRFALDVQPIGCAEVEDARGPQEGGGPGVVRGKGQRLPALGVLRIGRGKRGQAVVGRNVDEPAPAREGEDLRPGQAIVLGDSDPASHAIERGRLGEPDHGQPPIRAHEELAGEGEQGGHGSPGKAMGGSVSGERPVLVHGEPVLVAEDDVRAVGRLGG